MIPSDVTIANSALSVIFRSDTVRNIIADISKVAKKNPMSTTAAVADCLVSDTRMSLWPIKCLIEKCSSRGGPYGPR